MEELIKSYGLDYKFFKVILSSANGIIAGSSVLYEFLKASKYEFSDENSEVKTSKIIDFKPNDLDIWIEWGGAAGRIGKILETYLESLGYTEKMLEKIIGLPSAHHNYCVSGIANVLEFKNEDKIIQIIYIENIPVRKFISDYFDLSCCMVYWDSLNEKITHFHPEATLKGRMKAIRNEDHLKVKKRIQKYESRGFKLCQKLIEDVTFEEDSIYNDIECYDIIEFEHIKIPQFIEKSKDGIVIKCGESYYGFEREYFLEYLRTHLDLSNYKYRFLSYSSDIRSMTSPMQITFSQKAYFLMSRASDVIYEHINLHELRSSVNILKSKDKDRIKTLECGFTLSLDKDLNKLVTEINEIETKLLEERLKNLKSSRVQDFKPVVLPVVQVVDINQVDAAVNLPPLPPLPDLQF
jgi:hypothetical protein